MDFTAERRANYEAEIRASIDLHKYTMIGVGPGEGEPAFIYTLGLCQQDWPEIILIGNLNMRVGELILTDLINRWQEAGAPKLGMNEDMLAFKDGSSHGLIVRTIHPSVVATHAFQHSYFFPGSDAKWVQVLWPDAEGHYPEDTDYNTSMIQPLLPQE